MYSANNGGDVHVTKPTELGFKCAIVGKHVCPGCNWTVMTNRLMNRNVVKWLERPSWFYYTLGREEEVFYLTMHSTHFIYGYMASGIW